MAIKGTNSRDMISNGRVKSIVEWTAKQNKVGNTSTITVKVYSYFSGAIYSTAPANVTVSIGDQSSTVSRVIGNYKNGVKKLVATVTKTAEHNSNGKLTTKIKVSNPFNVTYSGTKIGTANHDFNITLDQIPRESKIINVSSAILGETFPTFEIESYVDSYRHSADLKVDNVIIASMKDLESGTHTFKLTDAQVDNVLYRMPNVVEKNFQITIGTFSDSSQIGSWQSQGETLYISEYILPEINDIKITDTNDKTRELLGVVIDRQSRLRVDVDSSGVKGSTISTVQVTANKKTYSGTSVLIDLFDLKVTSPNESQTLGISIKVVDSRGRVNMTSRFIDVFYYEKPSFELIKMTRGFSMGPPSYSIYEDEEGDCMLLHGKINYHHELSSEKDEIPVKLSIDRKKIDDYNWERYFEIEKDDWEDDFFIEDLLEPTEDFNNLFTYEIKITVDDGIEKASYSYPLYSSFVLLDFNSSGKGLGIGKISEKNALEVNMNADFKKDVVFSAGLYDSKGNSVLIDYIVDSGYNENWGWEKWASGKLVQWGRVIATNGTTQELGGVFRSETVQTEGFPKRFVGDREVFLRPQLHTAFAAMINTTSEGAFGFRLVHYVRQRVDTPVSFYAIGKWK